VTARFAIGLAVAASAAAALLLGGALRGGEAARAIAPSPVVLQSGFRAGDTQAQVAALQAQVRTNPDDVRSLGLLGLAYEQRARETGDPSYYPKAAGVLRRALALEPDDLLATSALGSLALSQHRFAEALRLGRRAVALSPTTARSYGVVGDALVELGRYREAFAAFDTMAGMRPGLAAYARVSYAREVLGRFEPAVSAMRLAVDAATDQPEASAWTQVQLGKLYWAHGRLAAAAEQYRLALRSLPGYVYAYDALAQVEWALGHRATAIALERRAVTAIPLPQFVGALGDMLRLAGREAEARSQYRTVDGIRRLLAANGVRTELETAVFDIDHGVHLRASLALARRAQRERPSIDGDDTLAWALARNDRCSEAVRYSRHALRLGTNDATKLFHRAYVEHCLGRDARPWARRALALNPAFSLLWAPTARRLAS
jgi:tetratricopeptide (TPR) repeat protein